MFDTTPFIQAFPNTGKQGHVVGSKKKIIANVMFQDSEETIIHKTIQWFVGCPHNICIDSANRM